MSSASSGHYQSRLFNFIHQQSRRVTEQCQRTLRHIQVATSWVAPVVLYPLYLLFQPNRQAGKQIHQAVEDAKPQSPTVDAPIQQVLLFIDTLPLEEANKDSGSAGVQERKGERFINFPVIRLLIAKFVFEDKRQDLSVNREAQTDKAFLSPTLSCTDKAAPSLPRSLTDNRPLIRGIATQLLSRTLVLVTAQNEILDILTLQQQHKLQDRIVREVGEYWRYQRLTYQREARELHTLLPFLDRTFAALESHHLALSTGVITLGKRSWTISQQVKTQFQQYHSDTSAATVNAEDHTFRIQALIWAAIDYFFGNRNEKPTLATTSTPDSGRLLASKLPRKLPREFSSRVLSDIVSSNVDPWLTLNDLFGDVEPEGKSLQQVLSNQKTRQVARINLVPFSKLVIPALTQTRRIAKTAAATTHPLAAISSLQAKSAKECHQSCNQDTQHEPVAAWIETDATAIGYVKHPLEQLLEWLDRIMLWLEEVLIIVWRWMRSFI